MWFFFSPLVLAQAGLMWTLFPPRVPWTDDSPSGCLRGWVLPFIQVPTQLSLSNTPLGSSCQTLCFPFPVRVIFYHFPLAYFLHAISRWLIASLFLFHCLTLKTSFERSRIDLFYRNLLLTQSLLYLATYFVNSLQIRNKMLWLASKLKNWRENNQAI